MLRTQYCQPAWPSLLLLASLIIPLDAMAIFVKSYQGSQSTTNKSLAKVVPRDASTSSSSSSSSSGLTNSEIGGIVGGLTGMLVVCVAITVWVIRHLRKVKAARQSASSRRGGHRRSAHGSGRGGSGVSGSSGDSGGHKGSGNKTSKHKIVPTPSQVDQLDYDDLLERVTVTTTLASRYTPSVSGLSHTPTVGSSRTAATRVAASASPDMLGSPVASPDQSIIDAGASPAAVRFANTPPRAQNRPGRWSASSSMGADSSSSRSSNNAVASSSGQHRQSAWQQFRQARLVGGGSIRSAASSRIRGTPHRPAELGVDGGFVPELPAASQEGGGGTTSETFAWTRYEPERARARAVSGVSTVSGITAPSIGDRNSTFIPSPTHSRNHSGSSASFHQSSQQQQQQQQPRLGTVTENLGQDLHGHYGPTHAVAGQTLAGSNVDRNYRSSVVPVVP